MMQTSFENKNRQLRDSFIVNIPEEIDNQICDAIPERKTQAETEHLCQASVPSTTNLQKKITDNTEIDRLNNLVGQQQTAILTRSKIIVDQRTQIQQLLSEKQHLEDKHQQVNMENQHLTTDVLGLHSQMEDLVNQIRQQAEVIKKSEMQMNTLRNKLDSLSGEKEMLEKKIVSMEAEHKSEQHQVSNLHQRLMELPSGSYAQEQRVD